MSSKKKSAKQKNASTPSPTITLKDGTVMPRKRNLKAKLAGPDHPIYSIGLVFGGGRLGDAKKKK